MLTSKAFVQQRLDRKGGSMRSRFYYLGLALLVGALVLAGCGVNPDAQTGSAAPGSAPGAAAAPQAQSTPIILPTPPPMPTERPRPPTPTPPPAPAGLAPASAGTLASADFANGSDLSTWT